MEDDQVLLLSYLNELETDDLPALESDRAALRKLDAARFAEAIEGIGKEIKMVESLIRMTKSKLGLPL